MKFIVSSDLLYRNLSAISGVMGTNSTMPILDNFLVTIEGNQLKLTASDLESTMTSVIELDNVEGEGSVAVPAKILLETLKLMPDMPLVFAIDSENNILKFSSANGEYGAPCFPSDEYPVVKPIVEPKSFDIRASVLQRAISKTIFATGNDELRPNMMGVLCELSADNITFVATDAHKLVRYRNEEVKTEEFSSFILPKKPIAHLKNILGNADTVHVEYSENTHHIRFAFGTFELYSSLKEGKYPNYEAVIPKENPNILTIGRDEFLKSIRRLGNYSSQSTFQVRLSLGETGLNLTAEDMDFSYKGAENIQCEYQGEPMEIGFNSRFLREMIENIDADNIQMSFSKPQRAALISPTVQHDVNEDVLMLIMPVMLNY
ncbi:MAG: DNA polymerase III subunit beta [Bacteroidales bacterium]|jgi:DNA polymerase-3 subunit beta|nr:DNA polymerase III subunit beta [Bacteroidales bacterium]